MEILNLAVAPSNRRKGIAKALVSASLEHVCGNVFLEVRESNLAARQLYESIGFKEVNRRPQYYSDSQEAAIVMNFHSC
jgi:ribosomal-protein-alanine N-acetyltransferase